MSGQTFSTAIMERKENAQPTKCKKWWKKQLKRKYEKIGAVWKKLVINAAFQWESKHSVKIKKIYAYILKQHVDSP